MHDRPSGPDDVFVTGTFDNWSKSLPLVKQSDGSFSLTTPLLFKPDEEKIYFKYVVDGEWKTGDVEDKELDDSGIENNILKKSDISISSPDKKYIPESGGVISVEGLQANEKTFKTTVEPKEEPKQVSVKGEPGIAIPENAQDISAFTEFSTVDPKSLNVEEPTESKDDTFKTTVLPKEEPKQVSVKGEPGLVIPKNAEDISAFTEFSTVDPKSLNVEEPTASNDDTFTTTVLPKEEPKQVSLKGEPGLVIPENAANISAFTEFSTVDPKSLNVEEPTESNDTFKATVLPKEEPKQISVQGEPGIVIPENSANISAFTEVSTVDPKSLNVEEATAEGAEGAEATTSKDAEPVSVKEEPSTVVPEKVQDASEAPKVEPKSSNSTPSKKSEKRKSLGAFSKLRKWFS